MRRRFAVTALIATITLGSCLAAGAQGVRFISPEDGDTIRDIVRIQATKPSPDEGWISYKIESGGKGDFVSAVVSPFVFVWDTRARDENGNELFEDGQYTITAVAMSPSGRKVGEASITVTLKNALSAVEAPQRVALKLFYDRNQRVHYRAEARWSIRPAPGEEEPEDVYELAKAFNGALVANWRNIVMSPTYAAGHAVLHVVVGSAGAQAGDSEVEALDRAGHTHTYIALRNGEMRLKHDDETPFELAEMTVTLPDRELKVGDTWNGTITIWPDPLKGTAAAAAGAMGEGMAMDPMMMGMPPDAGMMGVAPEMGMMGQPGMEMAGATAAPKAPTKIETRTVRARHRVEGFEWVMGHPTVCIRSTYKVDNDKVTVPSPAGGGALGGEGMPFGGAPGEMMAPEMGMPGMEFGDTMGGAMGMGTQGAEKDTSYTGERITYWAYDLQRPIRIVDTITHTLEIERAAQAQMGMEGAMPGMPMEGVMPPEMVDPGMMVPPGAPGIEPGMVPPEMMGGQFGVGMQQIEPPKPMKVKIGITLVIQETDL